MDLEEQEHERQELINRINNKFIRKRKTSIGPETEQTEPIPQIVNELPIAELPIYHIPNAHPKTVIDPSIVIEDVTDNDDDMALALLINDGNEQIETFTTIDLEDDKDDRDTRSSSPKPSILKKKTAKPRKDTHQEQKRTDVVVSSNDIVNPSCDTSVSCNKYIYSLSTVIAILIFLLLVVVKFMMESKK